MMKKCILGVFCTVATLMLGYGTSFSQASATASSSATATIIAPLAVDVPTNLIFGNIAVNSAAGSAVLSASSSSVITSNGGVSLSSTAAMSTAAAVNVSGSASYSYAVNVAPSIVSLGDGRGNSVSLAPQLSANIGALDKDGKGVVYLGGTLTIMGSQPNGAYSNNGGIYLTLNYN